MKRKTNLDLVNDLMNYSPYGGLCQVFIIEAIDKYCEHVIKENPLNENSMISNEAWKGIAEDIKNRVDKFYQSQT